MHCGAAMGGQPTPYELLPGVSATAASECHKLAWAWNTLDLLPTGLICPLSKVLAPLEMMAKLPLSSLGMTFHAMSFRAIQ